MVVDEKALKRLIKENPARLHGIKDLGNALSASPAALSKAFGRSGSISSLGRTLGRLRLEALAENLIMFPEKQCVEVCYLSGFERPDVAARAFKRHFGMTMKQYRLSQHGEKPIDQQ